MATQQDQIDALSKELAEVKSMLLHRTKVLADVLSTHRNVLQDKLAELVIPASQEVVDAYLNGEFLAEAK